MALSHRDGAYFKLVLLHQFLGRDRMPLGRTGGPSKRNWNLAGPVAIERPADLRSGDFGTAARSPIVSAILNGQILVAASFVCASFVN